MIIVSIKIMRILWQQTVLSFSKKQLTENLVIMVSNISDNRTMW